MRWLPKRKKNTMYKIFLDTNIILDYLIIEREGNHAAQRIMGLTVEEKLESYISPISLLNIFYILRQQMTDQERKDIIESFLEILNVVELDFDTLQMGLFTPIANYEDGVQYISAKKACVDFIITGDERFRNCDLEIPIISSSEFIKKLEA
jgi:predicted nucleic acid-binding protein